MHKLLNRNQRRNQDFQGRRRNTTRPTKNKTGFEFIFLYLTPRLKYFHLWCICTDFCNERKKLSILKLLFCVSLTLCQRTGSFSEKNYGLILLAGLSERLSQAPSTRIRMFLNPQLFLSGYGYRPHAYGEFASKSGNFLIRSPEWKFFNPITFRIPVDGRIRIFSDTMSSQNWRQYLPRKFKHSRRSKANSFCAPWAYFQSFSLYAAKCRPTKC